MSLTIYGIANCDTVGKTRRCLESCGVAYDFVDVRETPVDATRFARWFAVFGPVLLNKRSATYRTHKQLADAALQTGESAVIALLAQYPTMIKRPVIEQNGQAVLLGFNAAKLQALIA